MSVNISPNLPANVVEIGNEITQAKIDEINAGTLATQTWVNSQEFATQTWVNSQGFITSIPTPAINTVTGTNWTLTIGDAGCIFLFVGGYSQITVPDDSSVNFPDGTRFVIATDSNSTYSVINSGMNSINGGGVVSLNVYSVYTLIKISSNNWTLA